MTDVKAIAAAGKRRMDHVPVGPILLLSDALQTGADKYGVLNWRDSGVEAHTYYNALLRHLWAWWEGEDTDPESGLPHLAHAMACLAILMDAKQCGALDDNRPSRS